MKSNVIDQPAKAGEDQLHMNAYVDALTEFIANAEAPLTIALQGEWGSGKTSLMNALEERLVEKVGAPYLGVWINTWQYALMSKPDETIVKILSGIIATISDTANISSEERIGTWRKLARFAGSAASQVIARQVGIDFKKNLEEWQDADGSKSSVEILKTELGQLVDRALKKSGKSGFLFFIDDLDRIDPPVAVQILELLKNIIDLDKCIFILAIDYGVVVKGLKPKFGEKTPENEREFRSFFDKIIQLPFSMPVGAYKIDDFLVESLEKINYLDGDDRKNKELCKSLMDYALESVGTNPRSLKRLINSLSLIRLLIERTATKKDDEDFKKWKDVMFALVCLQIQYPRVYDALRTEPDFPFWNEKSAQEMRLEALKEEEKAKLCEREEFDEEWEQLLFQICRGDTFLEARSLKISQMLNNVKRRIEAQFPVEKEGKVGEVVKLLLKLSAVTDVKAGGTMAGEAEGDFYRPAFLHALRESALCLRWSPGANAWVTQLENGACLSSSRTRLQTTFDCDLWSGDAEGGKGDFLTRIDFRIDPGESGFLLRFWGQFLGNQPQENFKGLDLASEDAQTDVVKVEESVRGAWWDFDVTGECKHAGCLLWWSATIPFFSRHELAGNAFSRKFRKSLAKLADAFASLLKYRIPVNP